MSFETVADILQIIFADIILSGDNALVIGMAASCLRNDPALLCRPRARHSSAAALVMMTSVTAFGWMPRDKPQTGR
jgi:predicted tellurium resistance membrane protein TerC